ncbi:MAG: pullulanase, type, partial [Herbinix sp.]|nr:pullulanase, type [Herbinix sp.]
ELRRVMNGLDPSILIYGEGWTGGLSPLPDWKRAIKNNIKNMNLGIAAFNDNLRDTIKGSVFHNSERGYINGRNGLEESIKFGVAASTWHQGVDYGRVVYSSNAPWAAEPTQTVNYTSAHDNYTLWDKLALSNPKDSLKNRVHMNLLSAAILFTCQGIPFFQAGEEFLRSKPLNEDGTAFDDNSYRSPDTINSLKWNQCHGNKEVVDFYKGMIAFRKEHNMLRFAKAEELRACLKFLDWSQPNVVAFLLTNEQEELCVIYNANQDSKTIRIQEGDWKVYVKGIKAGTQILEQNPGGYVTVEPISALIMKK